MSRDDAWPNLVGLAAYGLYKRIEAIMERATPRGHLRDLSGTPMTVADLSRIVGEQPASVRRLLDRLATAQVLQQIDGVLVDRDMIHRAAVSAKRSDSGRRGAEQTNRQRPQRLPQQNGELPAELPQQNAPVAALGAASVAAPLVKEENRKSSLEPSTTTTSDAKTQNVDPEERIRRLHVIEHNPRVMAIAEQFPSDGDRALFCAMLVQVSLKGGPGGARGQAWLAEITDMLNPQRMHGQPVPMGILAQAIRDFGANGFLDDEADPKPAHFRAFVEYVRAGTKPPVRAGRRPQVKEQQPLDTSGNTAASDRLRKQLES